MIKLPYFLYSVIVKKSSVSNTKRAKLSMLPSMTDEELTSPGSYTNWGDVKHISEMLEADGLVFGQDFIVIDANSGTIKDLDYKIYECDWIEYNNKNEAKIKNTTK